MVIIQNFLNNMNFLPWLNQTTIGNQGGYFKKKRAYTYVNSSVSSDNIVTASVTTDNTVYVSVPTNYHVSGSNFASINKGRQTRRKEELK